LLLLGTTAAPLRGQDDAVARAVERFDLATFERAVGDRRIVLLGENGHGAGQVSALKASIVRHLYERLGFTVVAFESGFHECREVNERLARLPAGQALDHCLIWVLEHEEIVPLFEYARATQGTARPLAVAGIDLQLQGAATASRPAFFREALRRTASSLADTVALLDSTLVARARAGQHSVRAWIRQHGPGLMALYDSAATLTGGDTGWTFRTASTLMRRELHRVAAMAYGLAPPTDVYAIRDEWMAATIEHLAGLDSTGPKVVVWLHNDHARYGDWRAGPLRVRAAGQWLRERRPDEVFSVGFLMGRGTSGDNFRRPQPVAEPPEGSIERVMRQAGHTVAWLRLRDADDQGVRRWMEAEHPYVRGDAVQRMRPGREFDALIYVDSVSVAKYR
jgi:erythromycin esterase